MPTLYLPFTHISRARAAFLSRRLGRLSIYQPADAPLADDLYELSQKGVIEIRVPPGVDGARLASLKSEYRAWAELHKDRHGLNTGAFLAEKSRIPFFGPDSTAHIHWELKKLKNQEPAVECSDPLLNSRLFLALAEEHDRQMAAVDQDLKAINGLEEKLLGSLMGEAREIPLSASPQGPAADADPGAFMTVERIGAWSCLFLADSQAVDCLVTDSRAVMDQLLEDVPEMLPIPEVSDLLGSASDPSAASAAGYSADQVLAELVRADDPLALAEQYARKFSSSASPAQDLFPGSGHVASGISPRQLFKRYSDTFCREAGNQTIAKDVKNTVIVWLDIRAQEN
jgi:hypothetical protein